MKYMLVRHRVADFERWKEVFDRHAEPQADSGLKVQHILRNSEDPQEVFLWFELTDPEKAHAFVNAPAAHDAAEESGVLDEPDCWILE